MNLQARKKSSGKLRYSSSQSRSPDNSILKVRELAALANFAEREEFQSRFLKDNLEDSMMMNKLLHRKLQKVVDNNKRLGKANVLLKQKQQANKKLVECLKEKIKLLELEKRQGRKLVKKPIPKKLSRSPCKRLSELKVENGRSVQSSLHSKIIQQLQTDNSRIDELDKSLQGLLQKLKSRTPC